MHCVAPESYKLRCKQAPDYRKLYKKAATSPVIRFPQKTAKAIFQKPIRGVLTGSSVPVFTGLCFQSSAVLNIGSLLAFVNRKVFRNLELYRPVIVEGGM